MNKQQNRNVGRFQDDFESLDSEKKTIVNRNGATTDKFAGRGSRGNECGLDASQWSSPLSFFGELDRAHVNMKFWREDSFIEFECKIRASDCHWTHCWWCRSCVACSCCRGCSYNRCCCCYFCCCINSITSYPEYSVASLFLEDFTFFFCQKHIKKTLMIIKRIGQHINNIQMEFVDIGSSRTASSYWQTIWFCWRVQQFNPFNIEYGKLYNEIITIHSVQEIERERETDRQL